MNKSADETSTITSGIQDALCEEPSSKTTPPEKSPPPDAQPTYAKGLNLFVVSLGLGLTVMCAGLDRAILSTAVPKITAEFNSLPDVGWYGSAYLLTSCCFQLMYGKLYAEYNTKWLFLSSLATFELGSIICAVAPNSIALIIGRAVAGLGGAGILSGAFMILAMSVPLHRRPIFTGAVGSFSTLAQAIAPFLGGVFTDRLTWRWCFWINLPLGGVTFFVILFFLHLPAHKKKGSPKTPWQVFLNCDPIGTLLLFVSTVCLLVALAWGGSKYDWSNWRMILLLCIFGVTALIWAAVQWKLGDQATVPGRIIRMRSMSSAMWFGFCLISLMFVVAQYVAIWFQAVKNVTAYQSGINFLITTISTAVSAIFAGFMTSKIGYYVPPMYLCSIIVSVALGLIYRFDIDTSTGYWISTLILYGLGSGIGIQQPLMVPQTVLKGPDIAVGVSLILFAQNLSGALFLSIGTDVLQERLISFLQELAPQVDPLVVINAGASGLVASMEKAYPEYVSAILEAYAKALQAVFLVSLVMAALSIFGPIEVEWKSVKKDKIRGNSKGKADKV